MLRSEVDLREDCQLKVGTAAYSRESATEHADMLRTSSISSSAASYPPTKAIFDSVRIQPSTVVLVRECANLRLSLLFTMHSETS
jgi:hypothetical protein